MESQSNEENRATQSPPDGFDRLGHLEARVGELETLVRRQTRELKRIGYDRDLLVNSLRYLVQRHPHDGDDGDRSKLLAHFDRWEEQRTLERDAAVALDDDDRGSNSRIPINKI